MKKRHSHMHRCNFWKQWHEQEDGDSSADAWSTFFHKFMGTMPQQHWVFGGRRFKPWLMGQIDFNPFLAMMFSKGGGFLALYILHLLDRAPHYGNEIMQQIVAQTSGQWMANPGAVYPLLSMLEERGFITGEWEDPDKRTIRRYHITPEGEEELERLKAVIRPRLREAIDVMRDILSDLEDDEDAWD